MATNPHPRQPNGCPTGGQFVAKANPEADDDLLLADPIGSTQQSNAVVTTSAALGRLMAAHQIDDTDPDAMLEFGGDNDAQTLVNFIDEADTHGVFARRDGFPYSISAYDYGTDMVLIGISPTESTDSIWTSARVTTTPYEVEHFQYRMPTGSRRWASLSDVADRVATAISLAMPLVERVTR